MPSPLHDAEEALLEKEFLEFAEDAISKRSEAKRMMGAEFLAAVEAAQRRVSAIEDTLLSTIAAFRSEFGWDADEEWHRQEQGKIMEKAKQGADEFVKRKKREMEEQIEAVATREEAPPQLS